MSDRPFPADVGEWSEAQQRQWLRELAAKLLERTESETRPLYLMELFHAADHLAFYLKHPYE